MNRRLRVGASLAFVSLVGLVSCTGGPSAPVIRDATIQVRADLSGTMVATLVAQVTAPDIPTGLIFNIPIVNEVASGTITVPTGSDRTIAMRAYDASGVQTHSGSVTVGIQSGTNPTISVTLFPLTGDVPITATLGALSVTVAPSSATIAVGQTQSLTASIKDVFGNPVSGTVAWATRDPGIATVDATGLVTARGAGATTVSATYGGTAGVATITVTP